jgi:hypothetical protein
VKNMGILDPNLNPVRAGGLSPHEIGYLKKQGWKEGTTKKLVAEAPIGFSAPHIPGGFTVHNFSVPKGTKFLYNPVDERAIILACGNPTCWRYLIR